MVEIVFLKDEGHWNQRHVRAPSGTCHMGMARLWPAELLLLSDSHGLGFGVVINCLLGNQVNSFPVILPRELISCIHKSQNSTRHGS